MDLLCACGCGDKLPEHPAWYKQRFLSGHYANFLRGRPRPLGAVKKTAESNRGKKRSVESCKNIADSQRGKVLSLRHRRKIGDSLRGIPKTPEYREKMSEDRAGEKNPNWHGGSSFLPYNSLFNEELKEKIWIRDESRCGICKLSSGQIRLDVHHVDYNKDNVEPNNLILLCVRCHARTNGNREYWKNALQQLMARREGD